MSKRQHAFPRGHICARKCITTRARHAAVFPDARISMRPPLTGQSGPLNRNGNRNTNRNIGKSCYDSCYDSQWGALGIVTRFFAMLRFVLRFPLRFWAPHCSARVVFVEILASDDTAMCLARGLMHYSATSVATWECVVTSLIFTGQIVTP